MVGGSLLVGRKFYVSNCSGSFRIIYAPIACLGGGGSTDKIGVVQLNPVDSLRHCCGGELQSEEIKVLFCFCSAKTQITRKEFRNNIIVINSCEP